MENIIQAALTVFALLFGMIASAWRSSAKIRARRFLAIPVAECVNALDKPIEIAIFIDSMTSCLSDAITTTYSKSSMNRGAHHPL
jgi:hypothetical protein